MPGLPLRKTCSVNNGNTVNFTSKYNIVVLGGQSVGKSAIISQFLYDKFLPKHRETIEDLHEANYDIDRKYLTFNITDTNGLQMFPAQIRLNIQKAEGFVLVYSITDKDSFKLLAELRRMIFDGRERRVPIVVVGNKCDLENDRQVPRITSEVLVNVEWGHAFIEASAKENINIVDIFKEFLKEAHLPYALSPAVKRRRMSMPVSIEVKPKKKSLVKRNSCTIS